MVDTLDLSAPEPTGLLPLWRGLDRIADLAGLQWWWLTHVSPALPHDCAVLGEAEDAVSGLTVSSIIMQLGELHDDASRLLPRCSALLAAWSVMERPCQIDLGACECVGERAGGHSSAGGRRFLIHGARRRGTVVFTLMSARKWSEEDRAKQVLDELAGPLMQVSERIPERRLVVQQGLGISLKSVLTPREREIVEALGKGCTNKEIARYLGTSPNTVRNQLAHLTEKVGARSRAQLALLAQQT